jgi:hypothetical protein
MDKSVNEEEIKDCSKEQVKEENNNKIDIEPTLKLKGKIIILCG